MLQKPGSSSGRSKPYQSRRTKQESPDQILRGLQKLPANKRCCDCNSKLPSCVNLTVGSFICISCAGILRENSHRVKGIGHSSFTPEEAEQMKNSDNDKVNKIYLARFDPRSERLRQPQDNSDLQLLRAWIKRKYHDKSWYSNDVTGAQQQPGPTMAQIPPKQKAPQQQADLLGGFGAPAPAPAPQNDGWDAFGGSSQQQASFQSNFTASPQKQQPQAFQANFGSAPQQQQPQQQAAFNADFGNFPTAPAPAPQQQQNFANFGNQQQQQKQPGGFADFSQQQQQTPQQGFANFNQQPPPPQQQQQGGFANFGQQQPQQNSQQQGGFADFNQQPEASPQQQGGFADFNPQPQSALQQQPPQQQPPQQWPPQQQPPQQQGGFANFNQQQLQQAPQKQLPQQQQGFANFIHQQPAPQQQQQQQGIANFNQQEHQQLPPQQQQGFASFNQEQPQQQQQQQPTPQQQQQQPTPQQQDFANFNQQQPQQQVQQAPQQQQQQQQGFANFNQQQQPPQQQQQPPQQQQGFASFNQLAPQQQQQAAGFASVSVSHQYQPSSGAFANFNQQQQAPPPGQDQSGLNQQNLQQQQQQLQQGGFANANQQQPPPQQMQPPQMQQSQQQQQNSSMASDQLQQNAMSGFQNLSLYQPSSDTNQAMQPQSMMSGLASGEQPTSMQMESKRSFDIPSPTKEMTSASAPADAPAPTSTAPSEVSASVASQKGVAKYKKGQEVYYRNASTTTKATIVKVHFDDDLDPFYTVSVDGREKQTDDAHLFENHPLQNDIMEVLKTLSEAQLQQVLKYAKQQTTQAGPGVSSQSPPTFTQNSPGYANEMAQPIPQSSASNHGAQVLSATSGAPASVPTPAPAPFPAASPIQFQQPMQGDISAMSQGTSSAKSVMGSRQDGITIPDLTPQPSGASLGSSASISKQNGEPSAQQSSINNVGSMHGGMSFQNPSAQQSLGGAMGNAQTGVSITEISSQQSSLPAPSSFGGEAAAPIPDPQVRMPNMSIPSPSMNMDQGGQAGMSIPDPIAHQSINNAMGGGQGGMSMPDQASQTSTLPVLSTNMNQISAPGQAAAQMDQQPNQMPLSSQLQLQQPSQLQGQMQQAPQQQADEGPKGNPFDLY